jgi:ADP-ribosylglycohydrolase/fructose-1,6-bisphosphatase/inositol monophosphatase family enzyme
MQYEKALKEALAAALEAGELLRREFHRWGGPLGYHDHAEADLEAEWLIRNRLMSAFPQHRYRGEETGSVLADDPHVWLVDPNDGTIAYLRGARGSAVSIGLVRDGTPVLGVVYSYVAPDDRGDLIYWAEGFELTRNGAPVRPDWKTSSLDQVVLLVSMHRETLAQTVLDCIQPYRYAIAPSIAYRLALVAAGDASAAVSWHNPGDWDYAGGHALLRGAGGILLNETGEEVRYAPDGASKVQRCFGGDPRIVRDLWRRDWQLVQHNQKKTTAAPARPSFFFARPKPGKAVHDPALLSRAQGCLLGQTTGDALGSQVEFMNATDIAKRYPKGIALMENGGVWNTIAGQPTDDSEMALMLARSIVQQGRYDRRHVAKNYRTWLLDTDPFDRGTTVSRAVSAPELPGVALDEAMERHANYASQANGSLMRLSPLAVFGYRKHADDLWQLACEESRLTHPHSICQQACGLFAVTIAQAIRTGDPPQRLYETACALAAQRKVDALLLQALEEAALRRPSFQQNSGWVLVAFQNAFYQLLNAGDFREGVVDTVMHGDDSDTNAAIAGALLGAVYGRDAVPFQWRQMVLTSRPTTDPRIAHPRPMSLWPVDLPILTELLLLAG